MPNDLGKPIAENPFYILALPPTCSRAEAEREGQKWLAMIALGHAAAGTYSSPLGTRPRTTELVRWAMAELRDPERRLRHELWAQAPAEPIPIPERKTEVVRRATGRGPWEEALRALGWPSSCPMER